MGCDRAVGGCGGGWELSGGSGFSRGVGSGQGGEWKSPVRGREQMAMGTTRGSKGEGESGGGAEVGVRSTEWDGDMVCGEEEVEPRSGCSGESCGRSAHCEQS